MPAEVVGAGKPLWSRSRGLLRFSDPWSRTAAPGRVRRTGFTGGRGLPAAFPLRAAVISGSWYDRTPSSHSEARGRPWSTTREEAGVCPLFGAGDALESARRTVVGTVMVAAGMAGGGNSLQKDVYL